MRSEFTTHLSGWLLAGLLTLLPPVGQGATVDAGVDISSDVAMGLAGEIRNGHSWHGLALLHASWSNAGQHADTDEDVAFISVLGLTGRGPTNRFVGDLLAASNSEGHESLRLYATWWESRRGRWSVRTGLLLADEEFAVTETGGQFLNSAFGWPAFISASIRNTGPAFFAPGLGARLRWQSHRGDALQCAVYDGDTFDSGTGDPAVNEDGLHQRLSREQGLFAIAEYATATAAAVRMKVGVWVHTGDFRDLSGPAPDGSDPRTHARNHGTYAAIEHYAESGPRGSGSRTCHVRVGTAPADRNVIGWAFDAGAAWRGIIQSRPDDVLAIGLTQAQHSAVHRRSAAEADPVQPPPDYEQVVELTYRWAVSPQLSIQPDIQYIRHLGGSAYRGDALLLLVRLQATY